MGEATGKMKAAELEVGEVYVDRYGDEYRYVGPVPEKPGVPKHGSYGSGAGYRKPTKSDVVVEKLGRQGRGLYAGDDKPVIIHVSNLVEKASERAARRAANDGAEKAYQEYKERFEKVFGSEGFGSLMVRVPGKDMWAEKALEFDPGRVQVTLSGPDAERVMDMLMETKGTGK